MATVFRPKPEPGKDGLGSDSIAATGAVSSEVIVWLRTR
jgi:hypothetical protein